LSTGVIKLFTVYSTNLSLYHGRPQPAHVAPPCPALYNENKRVSASRRDAPPNGQTLRLLKRPGKQQSGLMKNIVRKADIILFILLIAAAAAGIVLMSGAGSGSVAVVRVDGVVTRQVDLGVDQTFRVGDVQLQVKDGAIAFIASDCPNKECIHAGWLKTPGSSAACLPNRVSVTIEGAGEQQEVDTVAE